MAVKSASDLVSITRLEQCSLKLQDWFTSNGMLLNPDKSEVLLVGSKAQTRSFDGHAVLQVAGTDIPFSNKIKSLGVVLDSKLTFNTHVDNTVKACNYHIRALRHIRPALDKNTANMVACSIVSSRLDYCNSLLYGTSKSNIAKLQRVQNTLARVVSGTKKRESITPVMMDLHWLPITARIEYKVALLTHKVLVSRQPEYLLDTICVYSPARDLRSGSQHLLTSRRSHTATAQQSLNYAAKQVWNKLSPTLRNIPDLVAFKKQLKTELFLSYYYNN